MRNSQSDKPNSFGVTRRIPRCVGYSSCLKGRMVSDNCYRVYFIQNNLGFSRLGIVAAKKLQPRAVDRNVSKREVREFFRLHNINNIGLDLVVMVRIKNATKALRIDSLSKLFNQVMKQCKGS